MKKLVRGTYKDLLFLRLLSVAEKAVDDEDREDGEQQEESDLRVDPVHVVQRVVDGHKHQHSAGHAQQGRQHQGLPFGFLTAIVYWNMSKSSSRPQYLGLGCFPSVRGS